jgi:hypothetical protein
MATMIHIYPADVAKARSAVGFIRKVRNPSRCPIEKVRTGVSNEPTRAKGMKPFEVDGMTIYAGSIGGARKKARLLKHFNA